MADVLIRGMEMPQRCLNCPFKQFLLLGNRNICLANGGKLIKDTDFSERDKNCPLVPLPEKHGRLIDADDIQSIINTMKAEAVMDGLRGVHPDITHYMLMQEMLEDSETIIEAEGGSDG